MPDLWTVITWATAIAFAVYVTRQCRRPSGPVGWLFAPDS